MSDTSFPASSLLPWWPMLACAFCAGAVTQWTRQLTRARLPGLRSALALGVAAGVAALSVVALLDFTLPGHAHGAALLAAACITGWSGPRILSRLGHLLERRLGLERLRDEDWV